ncbi:hypothetical protein TVAG_246160 [Trichomonas vaginalis G3]|uniref:Uncharacterized protein n=1 Tax=Trichomonas vaginalis (strain ATCC PRA-98 / G3) TaxID=412133 RepID=A2E4S2_TRIV3|nr:phosphorelay sensor kinase protein [Trichomonas vaginalis G3]EAY12382.1 hypothetical protein TVAG_246160 [Trichomonas vaginalis G3]KAI5500800.1 phosphorelay sensor kinase protein [Trichomonas vaginalis G3]|eukprot:XP_001324605.1 hypothetical protein [Trichomonas vaginalis G3]
MLFALLSLIWCQKPKYYVKIDIENLNDKFSSAFDMRKQVIVDHSDFLVTTKPQDTKIWRLDCIINVPVNNIHILEKINFTDKTNKFLYIPDSLLDEKVINKYMNLGFEPVSKMQPNIRYILSSHDQPGYNMLPYSYSLIQGKSSASVYSQYNVSISNPICHKMDLTFYKNVVYLSILLFIILMSLRVYFFFLPFNFNDGTGSRFWFVSNTKIDLTSPANLSFANKRKLSKLLDLAEETKKNQQIVIGIKRTAEYTELSHLFVYTLSRFFFVAYWIERYEEIAEPLNTVIEGAQIHLDDSIEPTPLPITISYENGLPKADISFNHFDKKANVEIKSNVENDLPFGSYSLHLSYIDCMHLGIINQIAYIPPTLDAFKNFISMIFKRLDFASLDVITITGNKIEEIVKFSKFDDTQPIVDSIIRKMPTHKGPTTISQKHIGDYMFTTNRFQVANVAYIVLTGQIANHLSLCVTENTFHFIMSMLVSYHHSVLSSRVDARSLMRVHNLLERTEIFSLVECVGNPSHFLRATGKIYDMDINQEIIDKFLELISPEIKSRILTTNGRQELNSYVVMFTRSNGQDECVSISSTSYYDKTIAQNIYLYLVEDVSSYYRRSQKLKAAHDDLRMASDFLGLHKVSKNMDLVHPSLLSIELGYNGVITSLLDVIYEDDKNINFEDLLDKEDQISIRLVSSLGHPVNYVMIKAASDGNYFIFASRELRQLRAISSEDHIKQITNTINNLESDFILILSDMATKDCTVIDSQGKLPNTGQLNDIISLITNKAPHETVNSIQAKIQSIKDEKGNYVSFDVQLAGKIKTMTWFKIIIAVINDKMILFIYNNNTKKQSLLAMSDMMKKAESFLGSTKMFYWFFEDANEPKRTFNKPPMASGQITFNWSSIESVCREKDRKRVTDILRKAIDKKGDINAKVVLIFDKPREYLLRGSYNNGVLCGIATNVNWISKSIKKTKEAIHEEQSNAERAKEIKHDSKLKMYQLALCLKELISSGKDIGFDNDLVNIVVSSLEKIQQLI